MRTRHHLAAIIGVVLALTGAACAGPAQQDPGPSPTESAPVDEAERTRLAPADVTLSVTGAAELEWSGRQDLRITRVGEFGTAVNLLSVGVEIPYRSDDPTLRFRWALDILNAYDNKPGTFELAADDDAGTGLRSLAFLILLKVVDEARDIDVKDMKDVVFLKEFRKMDQACQAEIGEGERTGSLHCPALSTEDGETVALRVTWTELEQSD